MDHKYVRLIEHGWVYRVEVMNVFLNIIYSTFFVTLVLVLMTLMLNGCSHKEYIENSCCQAEFDYKQHKYISHDIWKTKF